MKEAFDKIRKRMKEMTEFLSDCTKYGNKDAKQQEKSYSTMYMYEIADMVEDLIEIVFEVEAEYGNKKTNADRIRSMSYEELAKLTLQYDDEYGYFYCSDGTSYDDYGNGYDEALKHEIEWLKSPTND